MLELVSAALSKYAGNSRFKTSNTFELSKNGKDLRPSISGLIFVYLLWHKESHGL